MDGVRAWIGVLCFVTGVSSQGRPDGAAERYQSATVDAAGRLLITTTDRRTILVPKVPEQTSFVTPIVSDDRTAVGAQAEFSNCCTSYAVPLQLVVYANGRVHRFTGAGLPILKWRFVDAGARVAFAQEPLHFGCSIHFELREVRSEILVQSVDVPEPCGQDPHPEAATVPPWVRDLDYGPK